MDTLYLVLKTLHILAFIVGIGITVANLIAYNQFWKLYQLDFEKGIASFAIIKGFFVAGAASMLILILAGLGMLAIAEWSYVQLLWFQVKLGMIVLIFVNGFTQGRSSAMKVQALIERKGAGGDPVEISSLQAQTRRFISLQLLIFFTIVVLSVFRFV